MNAAEIIRNLMNVVSTPEKEEPTLANSPDEHVIDTDTVFNTGNDLNKPKNPADIRTNAPSMYPNYQAKE